MNKWNGGDEGGDFSHKADNDGIEKNVLMWVLGARICSEGAHPY